MNEIRLWDIISGAVIPVAVAIFTGVWYVRRNRKIDTFNRAAEKFRGAFHDELMLLDSAMTSSPDTYKLLDDAFNKHRAAVEEFSPILRDISSFDAGGLEDAWNDYYRPEEAPDLHFNGLIQYAGQPICGYSEAQRRKLLAKSRIERILYYAQNR